MCKFSLSICFVRCGLFMPIISGLFLLFCNRVVSQPLSDTLSDFQLTWSYQKSSPPQTNYFLVNPQAYSATLMQNHTLFKYKKRIFGAGVGSEVMFNSNSSFVPHLRPFAPIQGFPVYPQYIPVAIRPGLSMFNPKSSGATLLQFGNLMDGSQGLSGGQVQLGKMWRIN